MRVGASAVPVAMTWRSIDEVEDEEEEVSAL